VTSWPRPVKDLEGFPLRSHSAKPRCPTGPRLTMLDGPPVHEAPQESPQGAGSSSTPSDRSRVRSSCASRSIGATSPAEASAAAVPAACPQNRQHAVLRVLVCDPIDGHHASGDQHVVQPAWDQCAVRDAIGAAVADEVSPIVDEREAPDLVVKLPALRTIFLRELVFAPDRPAAALAGGGGRTGRVTLLAPGDMPAEQFGHLEHLAAEVRFGGRQRIDIQAVVRPVVDTVAVRQLARPKRGGKKIPGCVFRAGLAQLGLSAPASRSLAMSMPSRTSSGLLQPGLTA